MSHIKESQETVLTRKTMEDWEEKVMGIMRSVKNIPSCEKLATALEMLRGTNPKS